MYGLTGSDEQVNRPSLAIAEGVQLRVQPALGASPPGTLPCNTLSGSGSGDHAPFPAAMPVAVRWGSGYVVSTAGSGLQSNPREGASRSSVRRVRPPDQPLSARRPLSRFSASSGYKTSCEDHGPPVRRAGASRCDRRRQSRSKLACHRPRGLPCDFGKKADSLPVSSSVSQ